MLTTMSNNNSPSTITTFFIFNVSIFVPSFPKNYNFTNNCFIFISFYKLKKKNNKIIYDEFHAKFLMGYIFFFLIEIY